MSTVSNLEYETKEFFNRYWNLSNMQPPIWSEPWNFNGSIPNNDKRGCYALFDGEVLLYIGVGIGKSFGKYHGCGLGDRLKQYWKVNKEDNSKKRYKPTDDWLEVTGIRTIGFDEENYPLAAALEVFLINKLAPVRNSQHKKIQ